MTENKKKIKLQIQEGEENSELLERLEEILKRDKPEMYRQLQEDLESEDET